MTKLLRRVIGCMLASALLRTINKTNIKDLTLDEEISLLGCEERKGVREKIIDQPLCLEEAY